MINVIFPPLRVFLFFSFFLIALQACKKETNVGSSLISEEDILNAVLVDTFTVDVYTEESAPILTERISKIAVGEFNDPDFGITHAQFFTQFYLSSTAVSFGTNPIIDSIVLSFQVDTIYGAPAQQTTFKVYNLTEAFSKIDTAYYSNNSLSYSSSEIGSANYSSGYGAGMYNIKLQDAIGQSILNASTSDLESNENFVSYFKGLSIKTEQNSSDANSGNLYMINPHSTSTKLKLYYHNTESTESTFELNITGSCRYFGRYEHDYSGTTDLKDQLSNKALGKAQLFVKPLAGTRVVVQFPNIVEWAKNKEIIIHRAELIFPKKSNSDNLYSVPQATVLLKDSLGTLSTLPEFNDQNYSGMSNPGSGTTYGGGYSNEGYSFLISRYLQNKMNGGDKDVKLALYTYANGISPGRVIIEGTDQNKSTRTKVVVYYSTK